MLDDNKPAAAEDPPAAAKPDDLPLAKKIPSTFFESMNNELFRMLAYRRGSVIAHEYEPNVAFAAISTAILFVFFLQSLHKPVKKDALSEFYSSGLQFLQVYAFGVFSVVASAILDNLMQKAASATTLGVFGLPWEIMLLAIALPILVKHSKT